MRGAHRGRGRAVVAQHGIDRFHRAREILVLSGPARRMNAGRAAERIDRKTGIVGESGQAGRLRCGDAP